MNKFSITSAAGYARIAVAVFAGVLVLLHHLTLLEATATIAFVGTAIGSAGLIAAKDANGPVAVQTTEITPAHGDTPAQITTSVTPPEGEN